MTGGCNERPDRGLIDARKLQFSSTPLLPVFLLLVLFTLPLYASIGVNVGPQSATDAAVQESAAERALLTGNLDESLAMAQKITASNPDDGAAYLVMCRSYYAEQHAHEAMNACAMAVRMMPRSSTAEDWLGRADGLAAEAAGPVSGLTLALKVKAAFVAAVALDPENGAAVNDLSEFYIDAPSLLGGGLDKALALAQRVQSSLPQQADRIRALVAENQKNYTKAEQEFQAATAVANHPDAWVDLGAFYRQRGEYDKAVDALKRALAVDRDRDASVVDVASLLGEMHREPELEQSALREYLQGSARSDAAPAVKVFVMLGKILLRQGDKAGAKIEFEKALALASGYVPAQRALRQL